MTGGAAKAASAVHKGPDLHIGLIVVAVIILAAFYAAYRCAQGKYNYTVCKIAGTFEKGLGDIEKGLKSLGDAGKGISDFGKDIGKGATDVGHAFKDTIGTNASTTLPDYCPTPYEYYGSACYKPCPSGYERTAVATCKKGKGPWTSSTFGIDSTCQKGLESDAGLCYPSCPAGRCVGLTATDAAPALCRSRSTVIPAVRQA